MKTLILTLFLGVASFTNAQLHKGAYYNLREARENIDVCTALLQSSRKLTKVPPSVCLLVNLQHFDLRRNEIDSIPSCVGSMSSLIYFYLSANKFTKFPDAICNASNLEVFALDNNEIQSVPEAIGGMSSLQYLYLCWNQLSSLPEGIGKLKKLKCLEIQGNNITSLPSGFKGLSSLEELTCDGANITNLVEVLPSLKRLKVLSLGSMHGVSDEKVAAIKAAIPSGCLYNPTGEEMKAAGFETGYHFPDLWD